MPCISGNYPKGAGIILDVAIMKMETKPASPQENKKSAVPLGALAFYRALLDTGASSTCISSKVAKEVELEPTGLGNMVSASGKVPRNQYLFSVGMPLVGKINPGAKQIKGILHVFPNPIVGLEFHKDNASKFDVLLGMDIITLGSLKIDFDGHFSFCF